VAIPVDWRAGVSERDVNYVTRHTDASTAHARGGAPAPADLRSALAFMRERGLRVSAARRLVLEALLAADGPMSAEQIAEGIGGRVPSSDIASVYRNLQAFEDIGLVRHVHLGHGPGLHALAVSGEREYLTCERCADFRAVVPQDLDAVRELIEREFGYEASFTHFPIVGLCPSCSAAVREAASGNGQARRPAIAL
jgi:Fur family transcriptional regulator, ferric uptake regulator